MYGISNQFGVSVVELANLNNVTASTLKVGQVLTFYCTANDPASGWCCVDVRQGTEWKNLDGDHQLNGNGSTTVLTYTISAAALDQLVNNNGLVFTGTGMTITKVTLK